jgi:hypothetical protein
MLARLDAIGRAVAVEAPEGRARGEALPQGTRGGTLERSRVDQGGMMKQPQRDRLAQYVANDSIDIYSINYIQGDRPIADGLSVYFYKEEDGSRFIFSAEIDPDGTERVHRRAKVFSN